jgi:hypothetical protein
MPPGSQQLNTMWIYKVKIDHLGHVPRFKARFVAKGTLRY